MKIKRQISILLSFLILVSNAGLAFNVHYCEGHISSVTLAYKQGDACATGHKHKEHAEKPGKACCAAADNDHKDCCKDDLVKLQDKSDSKVIVKSLQLDLGTFCPVADWTPARFYDAAPIAAQQIPSFYCEAHAPPLFKLYCQYILYA